MFSLPFCVISGRRRRASAPDTRGKRVSRRFTSLWRSTDFVSKGSLPKMTGLRPRRRARERREKTRPAPTGLTFRKANGALIYPRDNTNAGRFMVYGAAAGSRRRAARRRAIYKNCLQSL
jgi:hypothetical protein